MSQHVRALTVSRNQSAEQLVAICGGIIKGLTGNPAFPSPPVDLKTVQTAFVNLNAAMAAQYTRNRMPSADSQAIANGAIPFRGCAYSLRGRGFTQILSAQIRVPFIIRLLFSIYLLALAGSQQIAESLYWRHNLQARIGKTSFQIEHDLCRSPRVQPLSIIDERLMPHSCVRAIREIRAQGLSSSGREAFQG
jgi:hypothetical protein